MCVICICKLIYLFVYRYVSVFYIGLGSGRISIFNGALCNIIILLLGTV